MGDFPLVIVSFLFLMTYLCDPTFFIIIQVLSFRSGWIPFLICLSCQTFVN